MRIGFIGNFIPSFSTENERFKAFIELGHDVIKFQENQTNAEQLIKALPKLDLLLYSHTHDPSYIIDDLINVFKIYKEASIPTVAVHLDRWAGLAREADVGKEATWYVKYLFMADASPEAVELYEKHNLNWHWLKPGVTKDACYLAEPDLNRFPHDIIFVGSKTYHPEYKQRGQLVEWLETTYGDRFGLYGGDGYGTIREDDLNTLYASAKIVVGDSCFAGKTSNYWSDRVSETTGRGGFLIHPKVEGLDHEGVVFYNAGDFKELKSLIDWSLNENVKREELRQLGHNWTKENRTYTHLAQEMLDIIFKNPKNEMPFLDRTIGV